MLNICFEVLWCFLQSTQYLQQFKIKQKFKKNFEKLLKFVIFYELFLQLRTPSFEKAKPTKSNPIYKFPIKAIQVLFTGPSVTKNISKRRTKRN
jgi:hypothetical protein